MVRRAGKRRALGETEARETAPDAGRTMLSTEEVAQRWGVNIKTVYAAIKLGQLPAVRLGRVIRIPAAVVISVEQGRGVPPGGPDGAT